jgi:hypothetical protein
MFLLVHPAMAEFISTATPTIRYMPVGSVDNTTIGTEEAADWPMTVRITAPWAAHYQRMLTLTYSLVSHCSSLPFHWQTEANVCVVRPPCERSNDWCKLAQSTRCVQRKQRGATTSTQTANESFWKMTSLKSSGQSSCG